MTRIIPVAPFGPRPLTASEIQTDMHVRKARASEEASVEEGPSNAPRAVAKWALLRALTEARVRFGLADRAIIVLDALFSFLPEDEIALDAPTIVFPSNRQLALRARGMAEATLRRHIAALVKAGLVLRRDSANGKRFARRGQDGAVAEAFGFDLAPLVLMAPEIFDAAEEARRAAAHRRAVREALTVELRACRKLLDMALGKAPHAGSGATPLPQAEPGQWAALTEALEALSGPLGRRTAIEPLEARLQAVTALLARLEQAWLNALDLRDKSQNMNGNAGNSERHNQNSKQTSHFDSELSTKATPKMDEPSSSVQLSEGEAASSETSAEPTGYAAGAATIRADASGPPLPTITTAFPEFVALAEATSGGALTTWREAMAAGEHIRVYLGISSDAWGLARRVLGDPTALTVLAYILERADDIRSPGGYLRALTAKAQEGGFNAWRLL